MHCISRKNTLNSLCVTIINDPKPIVGVNVFIYFITQKILFRNVLNHKIANRNQKHIKICAHKKQSILIFQSSQPGPTSTGIRNSPKSHEMNRNHGKYSDKSSFVKCGTPGGGSLNFSSILHCTRPVDVGFS